MTLISWNKITYPSSPHSIFGVFEIKSPSLTTTKQEPILITRRLIDMHLFIFYEKISFLFLYLSKCDKWEVIVVFRSICKGSWISTSGSGNRFYGRRVRQLGCSICSCRGYHLQLRIHFPTTRECHWTLSTSCIPGKASQILHFSQCYCGFHIWPTWHCQWWVRSCRSSQHLRSWAC